MLKGARAFVAVSLVSALVLLSFSVVMLSAKKYSGVSADQFVPALERLGYDPANVVLGIDPGVAGQFGPAIEYHARMQGVADVVPLPLTKPIPAGRQLIVIGPTPAGAKPLKPAVVVGTAPVVFGFRILEYPGRVSWFNHMPPEITRIGPWWRFGFDTVQVEASEFSLSEIPATR
jgi:hypothetical protein